MAHRPGETAARVARNLETFLRRDEEDSGPSGEEWLVSGDGCLRLTVAERRQGSLLMDITVCEAILAVPTQGAAPQGSLTVCHTGWMRRSGVRITPRRSQAPGLVTMARRLEGDADLRAALMPLDFRRCRVVGGADGWRVVVEHFGGSTVRGRVPPFHRYIPITVEQGDSLVRAFRAFQRLLAD